MIKKFVKNYNEKMQTRYTVKTIYNQCDYCEWMDVVRKEFTVNLHPLSPEKKH